MNILTRHLRRTWLLVGLIVGSWATAHTQTDVGLRLSTNTPTFARFTYVTYNLVVENNGNLPATGVEAVFNLPTGTAFNCSTTTRGTWSSSAPDGKWRIGDLAAGARAELQVTVFTLDVASIQASAQVQTTSSDPNMANNTASVQVVEGPAAPRIECNSSAQPIDLALEARLSNAEIPVGNTVSFILNVTNNGPADATGVAVRLDLPAGFAFGPAETGNRGRFIPETGVWEVGNMPAGAFFSFLVNVTVNQGGSFSVPVQISAADQTDVDSRPNSLTVNGTPSEDDEAKLVFSGMQADLSLTAALESPNTALAVNTPFNLVVTLHNNGPTRSDGTKIRAFVPAGYTLVSATATVGVYDNVTGVWLLSTTTDALGNKPGFTLAANATAQLTLRLSPNSTSTTVFDAEVRSTLFPDPDSQPSNNVPTEDDIAFVTLNVGRPVVTPAIADLEWRKTVLTPPIFEGDNFVSEWQLVNNGPQTANNTQVALSLPAAWADVTVEVSAGTYNSSTRRWLIPTLAVGQTATLTLRGKSPFLTAAVRFFAQVVAAEQADSDSTPNNNLGTSPTEDDEVATDVAASQVRPVEIPQYSDVALTLTATKTQAAVGERVVFTLKIENRGTAATQDLRIKRVLPAGLTSESAVAQQGTFDAATQVWSVGVLPAGSFRTLNITDVVGAIAPTVTVFAQVVANTQTNRNSRPNNNTGIVPTEVDEAAFLLTRFTPASKCDVELFLTGNTTYFPYQFQTFTLKVVNQGTIQAKNVVVSFPFSSNFIFSGAALGRTNTRFDGTRKIWTIPTLAPNQSLSIQVTLLALGGNGTLKMFAQVTANEVEDNDSAPNNNTSQTPVEDDEAQFIIRSGFNLGLIETPQVAQTQPVVVEKIYPMPVTDGFATIAFSTLTDGPVDFDFYDQKGQLALRIPVAAERGTMRTILDLTALPRGLYLLHIPQNGPRQTPIKVMKVD